ncbi:hypothetical protein [Telmatospirillum siberiense]|uniref:Lipoprotein n=1 Tax=Telmatospirillum siberiense TaxID=382514 RepID=A0A2N3PU28_9PROT|nr:hypothetical protein [Telmatospirillum siberiense]PKU23911.1 hypothetical protein CWS72_13625 [Telmatospirillum siberiense]
MGRTLICLLSIVALSGCGAWNGTTKALQPITPPAVTYVLADGISLINTQKTIEDHVISLITGMDCSTVRASKGDHYCLEPPQATPVYIRTSYCYKSIARVSCYDQPLESDANRLYGIRIERVPITTAINSGTLPASAPQ